MITAVSIDYDRLVDRIFERPTPDKAVIGQCASSPGVGYNRSTLRERRQMNVW